MYPLKLEGDLKEKVWGGDDLKYYHKSITKQRLGEVWELACHPNGASTIVNGEFEGQSICNLLNTDNVHILGHAYDAFPIMVKFLDARSDLSLQVHPDDNYAQKKYKSLGKTEVWYILSAEEDAEIILGTKSCSIEQTLDSISKGDLNACLNHIKVKAGEFYTVPAGTIHGIGSGVVLLEIQESSDLTFRLFDYGRGRETHLEQAQDVIDLETDYGRCRGFVEMKDDTEITYFIQSKYFEVSRFKIREKYQMESESCFQLLSCIGGMGYLMYHDQIFDFKTGDQFLIPANMDTFELRGMIDVIVTKPGTTKS